MKFWRVCHNAAVMEVWTVNCTSSSIKADPIHNSCKTLTVNPKIILTYDEDDSHSKAVSSPHHHEAA